MVENEKERGKAIGLMPPPARNELIARMMLGADWQKAQMAMFMLMGAWGIAPGPPPGAGGPPPGHGGPSHP